MRKKKLAKAVLAIFWLGMLQISGFAYPAETKVNFPEMEGYKIVQEYPVYVPDDLWDYINGGADAYLNYGFTDLHIAEYKKGENTIKVEVYHHKDNVYAYGMYALERGPDYHYIQLGVQGYAENSLVNFVKGPWYVKVSSYNDDAQTGEILLKLAESVEKNLEGKNSVPDMFSYFPDEGKILNSESFIASSFLGYSFLNEVFTTSYKLGEKSFRIFILISESDGKAKELINELLSKAKSSEKLIEETMLIEDPYNGKILIKRDQNRIIGCLDDNTDVELFKRNVSLILSKMDDD